MTGWAPKRETSARVFLALPRIRGQLDGPDVCTMTSAPRSLSALIAR